jgi:hypothetical protein
MIRLATPLIVGALLAMGCYQSTAAEPKVADVAETKYLTFQLMTGLHGFSGPQPTPGHFALSKAQLEGFVHEVVKAIGATGDARHKLGFAVGPLCFDMSDEETRQFIHDSFAVARENDVAVAFHIDDSISWGERKDLLSNPDNIETADWKQKPSTGRRADWGPKPTRFPPQMCFNSPAIVAAVKDRAGLIGAEFKKELAALKSQGKPHLFAGVIVGWETQIGRDFESGRPLGYRALGNRGFSESNLPKDADLERVQIVKEFMELWANSLHAGGTPREKVFCHIAFTDQGLRKADAKESYAVKVNFALSEVAFSSAYRPGFSTYPEGATFKEVYAVLSKHGSPGWISAEGVNVSPTSMPGESTMETYLGRMFNHGAVMVNVFAWGIGGEAMRDNFFRRATENPEALAAYAKFLRHTVLVETAPTGFSSEAFQQKMRRIQEELPDWVQKSGKQAQAMPLTKKLQAFIKDRNWQEADKVADELLALMKGDSQIEAKTEALPLSERLPPKIQRIQKELPAWMEKAEAVNKVKAAALMKKMDNQLKAKNFEEVEKTADSILKLMGVNAPAAAQDIPEEALKRLRHELGGSFLVTRDKVQEELKLTKEQKEKLEQHLRELIPDIMQSFQKFEGLKPEERKKEFGAYRPKAREKLAAVLKETLNEGQRKRLRQMELQREGLFGDGKTWNDLQVTDEQRRQFMAEIQQTQRKIAPLMEEAQKGGNADEIRPKVLKMREDLQGKLEALLTVAQKKLWKEMLGKAVELGLLFDDVSSR